MLLKGIVTGIDPFSRTATGTAVTGAMFTASYYGAVPAVNDVVFIEETAPGSWVIVVGPLNAAGMFGVGGDGDVTLTATSTFSAARTTSADATASGTTKTTLTSASAAFTSSDIGSLITGTGITAGTIITGVTSTTVCTTSYPTTCSSAAVTITPVGVPFSSALETIKVGQTWQLSTGSLLSLPYSVTLTSSDVGATVSGTNIAANTTISTVRTTARAVTDMVTAGSTTITSATAAFTASDVGAYVNGTNLPVNTIITAYGSATSVTINNSASGSGSGGTLQIGAVATLSNANTGAGASASLVSVKRTTISLARDVFCNNLTLDPTNGPVYLRCDGYRLFVAATLYIGSNCTIHNNGFPASGSTAGAGANAHNVGGGTAGGAGKSSSSGNGAAGTNATNSIATLSTATAVLSGGWGGDRFAANPSGAVGGTIVGASGNPYPASAPFIYTLVNTSGTIYTGGAGGGGGGADTVSGGGYGGGGGGGGGVVFIACRVLINYGTIQAAGGRGMDGYLGASTAASGGGGGGGGAVVLIFGASGSTPGSVSALSGASGGGYGTTRTYTTGGYGAFVSTWVAYGQTITVVNPGKPGVQGTSTGAAGLAGDGLNGMIWALAI